MKWCTGMCVCMCTCGFAVWGIKSRSLSVLGEFSAADLQPPPSNKLTMLFLVSSYTVARH